ncbi:MAG: alanine racemase [Lachnospiraceae bacterium]
MKTYSRVYAKIDLDTIAYNMEQMKKNLSNNTKIIAVIKTDGYGHGAVQIAKMLEIHEYIWGYAVATLDEAVVLRSENVKKPILVLGCIFPDQYEEMLKHEIRMNVYSEEMAQALSNLAVEQDKIAYIHIKLDTGMARLGFTICQENVDAITRISQLPNLRMEGIFTHFAKADEIDKSFTQMQLKEYKWMVSQLKAQEVVFEHQHCANSAAIIDMPDADMDIVRAGIAIYGLYPSEEVNHTDIVLKPALELKSHLASVKQIKKGTPVSYGGTFIAPDDMMIATVPIGYGDGYPRSLSNVGYVLVRGQRAPIIGRICMDQFIVDVNHIPGVQFGDKVTLIGTDGKETLSVETLSELSGKFNYEFVCGLGKRIPRVYVKGGKISEQVDYFA